MIFVGTYRLMVQIWNLCCWRLCRFRGMCGLMPPARHVPLRRIVAKERQLCWMVFTARSFAGAGRSRRSGTKLLQNQWIQLLPVNQPQRTWYGCIVGGPWMFVLSSWWSRGIWWMCLCERVHVSWVSPVWFVGMMYSLGDMDAHLCSSAQVHWLATTYFHMFQPDRWSNPKHARPLKLGFMFNGSS